MNYRIVGDSCSDFDERMKKDEHFISVPLSIQLGDINLIDDDSFDQKDFLSKMKNSTLAPKTAAPSPELFKNAYEGENIDVYTVTLSEHLSGTYQSAVIAKEMYQDNYGDNKNILVLSSHSASAGQYRILLEIERLCKEGFSFEEVSKKIIEFRDKMKTYFVLENLDNLKKSGRLSGLQSFIATALNIKPIMGSEAGKIIKLDQARGFNKALLKMVEIAIKEAGESAKDMIVTISEVNNMEKAKFLLNAFKSAGKFKDVLVTKAMGISTVYAGDGGLVVAVG